MLTAEDIQQIMHPIAICAQFARHFGALTVAVNVWAATSSVVSDL